MGRRAPSTSFLTVYDANGAPVAESDATFGRGTVTLASGQTYFVALDGADAELISAHCQWDASIVITSITVMDSNMPPPIGEAPTETGGDVKISSTAGGAWIPETPSTAYVGTDGAGVTVTNGVVAVAGGAQGGCMFHFADTGSRRARLKIAVGGTGGAFRCAGWGKE